MVPETTPLPDDSIDIADLVRRLKRGLPRTLALSLIGVSLGIAVAVLSLRGQTPVTSLRVSYGFPGAERGMYPNGTKFQPDDVRAQDVINKALEQLGIADAHGELASKLRGSITISGLVSPTIVKERDRLRASGQTLPTYIPDEYEISLSLPRSHALDMRQRGLLLTEIVSAYQEKFRRTYVAVPPQFGNVFEQLRTADYVDYQPVLTRQMGLLTSFLEQQVASAKQFRSPTNGLSFQDLLRQSELFSAIRLNEVLGILYRGGLSKDRQVALANMEFQVRKLEESEQQLIAEQAVVDEMLERTKGRSQNYVLATKTELAQGTQPILDQGLVDSLVANDSYNYLVRRALDAGLAVKRVQTEKALLIERMKRIDAFAKQPPADEVKMQERATNALASLEANYRTLLDTIRVCMEDYARQEFADSVRVTLQAMTKSWLMSILLGAILGCGIGMPLGLGISLLDLGSRRPAQ